MRDRVSSYLSALKYLSRYLYRGVIGENHIVSNQDGHITFQYVESRTGQTRYRIDKGEDFLWLLLQHVLPKGFRRVRDYGFLQDNAKKTVVSGSVGLAGFDISLLATPQTRL